jgi:hypothetical protein
MMIVGSPRYLARHGVPKTPDDLVWHNRLDFSYARTVKSWPLREKGLEKTIPPSGNVQASDGDALRTLALNDVGLVRLASFLVKDDIASKRLVPVLEAFNPGDIDELHAVCLGQGGLACRRPVRTCARMRRSCRSSKVPLNALRSGQWLSERLAQPFITENRPGANGNITAKAPNDGPGTATQWFVASQAGYAERILNFLSGV